MQSKPNVIKDPSSCGPDVWREQLGSLLHLTRLQILHDMFEISVSILRISYDGMKMAYGSSIAFEACRISVTVMSLSLDPLSASNACDVAKCWTVVRSCSDLRVLNSSRALENTLRSLFMVRSFRGARELGKEAVVVCKIEKSDIARRIGTVRLASIGYKRAGALIVQHIVATFVEIPELMIVGSIAARGSVSSSFHLVEI